MDDVTYEALRKMIGDLTVENKRLRKINRKQKKKIKELQLVINRLKERQKKKQHYRNGRKRGRYSHGRNG